MCEGDWQMWHQVATLLIYLQPFSSTTEISLLKKEEEQDNDLCTFSTHLTYVK